MLQTLDLTKILFLDIETVSGHATFDDMPPEWKDLFAGKTHRQWGDGETAADFYKKRAGILAEFGKVVCVSVAFFSEAGDNPKLRVTSFYGHDEKNLLAEFSALVGKYFSGRDHLLCAHNGKEFDFPYLCRRMLVNGLPLPVPLNLAGKKPWDVPHLDTLELWKFGDYKNYTSLKLLAALFGIPSPKDDIDGSMVSPLYWGEGDLERIRIYCQKDTVALAQLIRAFRGEPLLTDEQVEVVD